MKYSIVTTLLHTYKTWFKDVTWRGHGLESSSSAPPSATCWGISRHKRKSALYIPNNQWLAYINVAGGKISQTYNRHLQVVSSCSVHGPRQLSPAKNKSIGSTLKSTITQYEGEIRDLPPRPNHPCYPNLGEEKHSWQHLWIKFRVNVSLTAVFY